MKKEYGGYIELDSYHLPMLHEGAVALNCGRNALAYLIRAKEIQNICLPAFLCDSVENVCRREGIGIRHYAVGPNFLPEALSLQDNEWLYIVNYYGQLNNETLQKYADTYQRIIVDQSQAYFQMPLDHVDTIYTCRKFFGVADGAFLYTDTHLNDSFPVDESFDRMHFLLGRYERPASEFYDEYASNNRLFANEPIKQMSKLTKNLLHAVDYDTVKQQRTNNCCFLAQHLNTANQLDYHPVEGAFAYPLWLPNGAEIRSALVKEKIYIPTLWPNVLQSLDPSKIEYDMVKNILPIPCDQRYAESDMAYILGVIIRLL